MWKIFRSEGFYFNQSGRHYLFSKLPEMCNIMMTHWMMLLKSLLKSSVDNYVLPGTLTGTEILWLYMIQWKRDLFAVGFALAYFLCSQFDFNSLEKIISNVQCCQEEATE